MLPNQLQQSVLGSRIKYLDAKNIEKKRTDKKIIKNKKN